MKVVNNVETNNQDYKAYLKLIDSHLQRIFRLVNIEADNQILSPDSFSLNISKCKRTAGHKHLSNIGYSRNEPRLDLIKHSLERALHYGKFLSNGNALSVDGLRWRNLSQWASYGKISATDAIGALSSECNCDCEFCHAKTLPAPVLARSQLSLKEAKTRIKYYSLQKLSGLPPITRLPLEPFSNRFSVDILKLIRKASPNELITEETNGSFLTEAVIAKLAEIKPIFLIVSLNGVEFDARSGRMREPNALSTQIAMQCPELMNKYKIPFAISYVPWFNRELKEIEDLVHYAESVNATRARVCLPVTHRFAHPDLHIDMDQFWQDTVNFIQNLRQSANIPIGTTPSVYEWQTIFPVVCGTVKDSPSARSGLRYGDIIIGIDNERVITRREARNILASKARSSSIFTDLAVYRNDDIVEVRIEHSTPIKDEPYPYNELLPEVLPFGIDLPLDISLSDAMVLQDICEEHQGKVLLLLLPQLAFNAFQEALSIVSESTTFLNNVDLHVIDVKAIYFGGSWVPARWWTVPDIIEAVTNWRKQNDMQEDILIMPAGVFSACGQDIIGNTIRQLESQLNVEIRRVSMSSVVT